MNNFLFENLIRMQNHIDYAPVCDDVYVLSVVDDLGEDEENALDNLLWILFFNVFLVFS